MDNYKSYEFTFLYLINKCILLFKYTDYSNQKEILTNIKLFINKLQEIFSNNNFNVDINQRKNKILEILISYFEYIIDNKIYNLIDHIDKNKIIGEVEKKSLIICEESEKKKLNEFKRAKFNNPPEVNETTIIELEKKINNKIINLFVDIENNLKKSLRENIINYDKINTIIDSKIDNVIQNKIKDILENKNYQNLSYDNIKEFIKDQLSDIFKYIKENENSLENKIKKNVNSEIESKVILLGNIFNENIQKIYGNLSSKIETIENKEGIEDIENKFKNFNMVFDKEENEIKLFYYNQLITSSKINIKGLIGPKGPQGNKGDKGETPIIRKTKITDQNKLKFTIQENNNIYEITTEESIPLGPIGLKGDKGDPGKCYMDLKWNQENVMRIDENHTNSLIFLKSLCVGDRSHALKDNSLAIGGAVCYQNNSLAIGQNAKSLDSESIALFGNTVGKNSFSYRAENVDENSVTFGKKDKANYNINSINIISKEINLECDILRLKTGIYENSKIKDLEDKIFNIEKKLSDILKKI